MLIDITCETHGVNKLELNRYEEADYHFRKDRQYALDSWIKNDLKCPVCSKEKEIEALKKYSGIPLRFNNCSFDNYKNIKEKNIVLDYVKNFTDRKKQGTSLILCGTTGTGKTHLSAALSYYLIENYQTKVLYTKAFDVLREVKETYNKKAAMTFSDVQKKHAQVELLIIDEVGVQFGTETEKQILFEIINERYENLRPTILVTNLSLTNLKEFAGDRVIDRMKENEGKIIIFSGESFRGKK
jgi:DNA replication protein DnaC